MKKLLVVMLTVFATGAHAAPPSRASIETLLELSRTEALMEMMYSGMEQAMHQGMMQALVGRTLTPEEQSSIDALPRQFVKVIREEMGWQQLKPDFIQIYSDTFQQADIEGLIDFYRSPAGQSFLNNMPTVMQRSMAVTQSRMQAVYPKMQAAMEKALADIQQVK